MRLQFHNPQHQQAYEKMGYVVIDFLPAESVKKLLEFYDEVTPKNLTGFHSTLHNTSVEYRKMVMDGVCSIVSNDVNRIFKNHQIITCSFVVKEPDKDSTVILHQDWNLTDEKTQPAFNIWTSLTDTNISNGALHVIPGSHQLKPTFRGTGLPDPCDECRGRISLDEMTCIETKAGQAVIYDVRTLHSSPPNSSEKTRISCAIGSVAAEADLIHFKHNRSNNEIIEYLVTPDFFLNYKSDDAFFETLNTRNKMNSINMDLSPHKLSDISLLLNKKKAKWFSFLKRTS